MSAITTERLRELRAAVLDRDVRDAGEARRRADAYVDATGKAPAGVLLWSWVLDWGRYRRVDLDVLRVAVRQVRREGWR